MSRFVQYFVKYRTRISRFLQICSKTQSFDQHLVFMRTSRSRASEMFARRAAPILGAIERDILVDIKFQSELRVSANILRFPKLGVPCSEKCYIKCDILYCYY